MEIEQIKNMSVGELNALCAQIRQAIKEAVDECGGHLSSNLGMVELTVALFYVFDFPKDKVIFDVGHQCYAYKYLSGRSDRFSTLRKRGGLSGFPKREESVYDCYNTGHAGTSISAALGIAKARDIMGENFNVMAVIGDGSFNNGLIYEAFNNLKPLKTNILVIINDNGMSISPTVGSMHDYLEFLAKDEEEQYHTKRRADIFEKFGFTYDGVYDGNDLACMIEKLYAIKEKLKTQSVILHVYTKKGKGYAFCEENPVQTHGVSPKSGKSNALSSVPMQVEYSEVFGNKLCELAKKHSNIVAITAAMTTGLGLSRFGELFPDRAIDVGICEEHATVLAASMATQGIKPYYAIYSTFLQRSYDEVVIDICSQNLPVTICIDRAGISGADGETHQGVFDLSFLTSVPNLTVVAPKDSRELEQFLDFSVTFQGPLAIRYPRLCTHAFPQQAKIEYGKWQTLLKGNGLWTILATGERAIAIALQVAELLKKENITPTVVNCCFVKPLDNDFLSTMSDINVVTIEDNMAIGGFGSLIDSYFSESNKRIKNFAYPDVFIPQGTVGELMTEFGVGVNEIVDYILSENRE